MASDQLIAINGASTSQVSATNGTEEPEIIFYACRMCPFAHRVYITLKELGLPYKEQIIDIDRPRDPWYLKVNPRGLVPSLSYKGNILTESAIIVQFLADANPSHLDFATGSVSGALARARLAFFIDRYMAKFWPGLVQCIVAQTETDRDAAAEDLAAFVGKELEPLIDWDREEGPFYGGSKRLTLLEVLTAPFLVRLFALSKPEYGHITPKVGAILEERAPKFSTWATRVVQEPNVNFIWDDKFGDHIKAKFLKLREAKLL